VKSRDWEREGMKIKGGTIKDMKGKTREGR
jgi:hypothetical protein